MHTLWGRPERWKLITFLTLALAAGWIALTAVLFPTALNDRPPAPRSGFAAPDFTLANLGGKALTLSDLAGRIVIVNLWASWCPPCKAEMPALEKIYRDYQDQGVIVLGVNATAQDSADAAAAFVLRQGLSFPILLDPDASMAHKYQLQALPTTFFVDQTGIIRHVVIGGPISEALLRAQVEEMLAEAR